MQWPQTSPSVKCEKVHLELAAFSTFWASIQSLSKNKSHLIHKADVQVTLRISIVLGASASFILRANWAPALMKEVCTTLRCFAALAVDLRCSHSSSSLTLLTLEVVSATRPLGYC